MIDSVLVTGAGGLLGRTLVARLAPERRVYAFVRGQREEAVPQGAVAVTHDLCDRRDPPLSEIPDTIIHLAQSPRYQEFPEGALDVFEVNVGSTQRLLNWASRHKVKRFIYASSGGLYGHGTAPFREDQPLPETVNHYLVTKRCAELLTEVYRAQIVVIVLRFFFIYGPRQRPHMLIPRLVNHVLTGTSITLHGTDGIYLNPVYVDDAAAAVEAAMGLKESETVNVAGPQVSSLREIGELIGNVTARSPRFSELPGTEPSHLVGDTTKMRRLLVAPQTGLAEGLQHVVAAQSLKA